MWKQVWNEPIYREWARQVDEKRYELVIARKEKGRYLLARAELNFGKEGLPTFVTKETDYATTEEEAMRKINGWKRV